MPVAVILGSGSDIGRELGDRLERDGWDVLRIPGHDVRKPWNWPVFGPAWDLFLCAIGTQRPIGKFFDLDITEWEGGVEVNALDQLAALHKLWPKRRKGKIVDVLFFAGGGTNGPMTNYSAYVLGKIMLIKMAELLHDENEDLNCFVIGPGYVDTKIHRETLEAGTAAGAAREKLEAFLKTEGTSFDDIYQHMRWCMKQGRAVAGGRNFSTVHDPWMHQGGEWLQHGLTNDPDLCRLRRLQYSRLA